MQFDFLAVLVVCCFKLVVSLLLVAGGSKEFLFMPPFWLELYFNIFEWVSSVLVTRGGMTGDKGSGTSNFGEY